MLFRPITLSLAFFFFFLRIRRPPRSPLFPSTPLFRSHAGEVDPPPPPPLRRHLCRRRRDPRRSHVLDRHDVTGGDQLEACFEQQLLREGVAHLHLGTSLLALACQLLGGERRAMDPVATGARSYHEQHVADAVRRDRKSVV